MNRISTFQISLRAEDLKPSVAGAVPVALAEPLQALVTAVTRRAADAPVAIYLCADDESAQARDDFALALARTLTAHLPSTLLVDCDFLRPGLSGVVPQKDALGFLDYLLYGSSIGVITQDADGVHIVGAGSFPVTKRMPFIEAAFVDAAKRLVTHSRCALFVGPAFDGDGGRHPLAASVDVVATLRTTPRQPRLDTIEESIAGTGVEVWSLRLGEAAAPAPAPVAPPEPVYTPAPAPTRPAPAPRALPPDIESVSRGPSLAPRIAVVTFGLLVIAFVVWWFMQNRTAPTLTEENGSAPVTAVDTTRQVPDTLATRATPADSIATAARPETTVTAPPKPRPAPANATRPGSSVTPGHTGGTMLVNSSDIQVMEDLDRQFHGWFAIHISSFQTSVRARDEVAFLESREFPVFIVFLDLGPKGKWYRVYAGPFQTREEALTVKKNLDAVPQVRFTRIASIPD